MVRKVLKYCSILREQEGLALITCLGFAFEVVFMTLLDYMNDFRADKSFDYFRKDYDDLFLAVIEFHLRSARGGIVLNSKHLDGVAGQELDIKDECCQKLYILFVYLVSNALNPDYILVVLKDRLLKFCSCDCVKCDCLPVRRILVMYFLLEKSLVGGSAGILSKANVIADMSKIMCSAEVSEYCFRICKDIENFE